MAHEIGHIVKRHLSERVEKGKYSTITSLGLALAAIAFGGAVTPVLLAGALATGQSINLHFSRQHEEEADLLAYGWMQKMKRNPEAQAKMLESMRRIARYRSDQLPQYLLTHPNPEGRLHYIESLLDMDAKSNEKNSVVTDDFEFLRFKYRILSKVKDIQLFKTFLLRKVGNTNTSEFSKNMALFGLSQVARVENDRRESLELIQKVIAAFPQKNILKTDLAIIEGESGHFDVAEKIFKEALKKDSEDMYAAFNLATLLRKIGKTNEAEKYFKRVGSQLPEYSQVYFELGKIASDNKQQGKAQFYLGKFDLYEGKLKLAEINFKNALRHAKTPDALKKESKVLIEKIKKMKS
jgi:predicted Zn-dependent protease